MLSRTQAIPASLLLTVCLLLLCQPSSVHSHLSLITASSSASEIVLYASEAPVKVGGWVVVSDATAAGGARLHLPDAGGAKLTTPLASPARYFEMTFTAEAGRAYRIWVRGKAQNDYWGNDSVFIQFSGSVNATGNAVYRIGTTSATEYNLEDCSGCGLSGWGWQDNGWGVGVMGPLIYFQSTGTQTLRVQVREDGLSIDQIVLSASAYLNTSPGGLKNDSTILPKTGIPSPAPSVSAVSPNSGSTNGGAGVTITGSNFTSGATVSFGGAAATSVNVTGSTTITAITPAHAAGPVNVVITNPDGQSGALANAFTFNSAAALPQFGHVLIVVEENQNYSSVIGSPAMPYLNTLASRYGLATNYYANTHPSIGNYFWLTTGQVITNDSNFAGIVTDDNIVRQLVAAGKTWKAYAESLPSNGYTGPDQYPYVKRHNPFAYFSDVLNSTTQANNLVPFSQFSTDLAAWRLPHYSFIIPNNVNNSHDCPAANPACTNSEKLAAADNWLRTNIDPLIASPAFQQDGLLVIVFDEAAADTTNGGGQVAMLVISPKARQGFKSTAFYQQQSTLRLMAEGLGLTSFPGAAATAPNMGEFFSDTPNTAPIIGGVSPSSGSAGGGAMITLSGTGFVNGATVTIGGAAATSVTVAGSTTITAVTPAHAAGVVDVTVINPNGQGGTLAGGYTYIAPPSAEVILLADDFNDNSLDASKWVANDLFSGFTDSTVVLSESAQQLQIGPMKQNTSGSHYNGIRSVAAFNFTGAYAYVELAQAAATATSGDAMMTVGNDANNYYRIYVEAGNLICQKRVGGSKINLFVVAYDVSNHKYLRIRHDAASGNVVFETASGSGAAPGVWAVRASEPWNTTAVPPGSIRFELKAGTFQAEANAAGTVTFDNFKAAKP